jgi:hypothetical protein
VLQHLLLPPYFTIASTHDFTSRPYASPCRQQSNLTAWFFSPCNLSQSTLASTNTPSALHPNQLPKINQHAFGISSDSPPVVPSAQLVYAASPPVLIVKSSIQIANTRPAAVLRFVLAPPSLDSPSMPFSDLHKSNVLTLASISDILCRHAHIFFIGSTYRFDFHSIALCCQHHQLSTFICTPLFG